MVFFIDDNSRNIRQTKKEDGTPLSVICLIHVFGKGYLKGLPLPMDCITDRHILLNLCNNICLNRTSVIAPCEPTNALGKSLCLSSRFISVKSEQILYTKNGFPSLRSFRTPLSCARLRRKCLFMISLLINNKYLFY